MQFRKYMLGTFMYFTMGVFAPQTQNTIPKDTIKTMLSASEHEALNKLNDNPKARKYDEKWLKELSNSGLFSQMSGGIVSEPTNANYGELLTEVLKERPEKLNEKGLFNTECNPVLEQVTRSLLKDRHSSLERLMSLSGYYFPMSEQEMSNQKTPLGIKYLAAVESTLSPRARSHAGATGLWQSMYATGKSYGLETDNYADKRSDPIRATKAAAKYLNELHKIFGDWDLVLTAYNSGSDNVTKVTRRSRGKTNYWNLRSYLPKEAAGYVPVSLATLYTLEYTKEHGFRPQECANYLLGTDTIRTKQAVPLRDITEIMGMDMQDMQFSNPSYQLDIVPYVEGRNHAIHLPISEIGKLVANGEATYSYLSEEKARCEKPLSETMKGDQYPARAGDKVVYTVKKGDNLGKVANRNGASISSPKRWNRIKDKNVRVGQRLIIYK